MLNSGYSGTCIIKFEQIAIDLCSIIYNIVIAYNLLGFVTKPEVNMRGI